MWDCHVGMLFTLRIQGGGLGALLEMARMLR